MIRRMFDISIDIEVNRRSEGIERAALELEITFMRDRNWLADG